MASPIVLSPDTAYATKTNIKFPGSADQATAARGDAKDRIEDAVPGITVTVAASAIVGE